MMFSKTIIANNLMQGKSPAKALEDANVSICANNRERMFVTVWLAVLELSTGKLTASNAGHEYPMLKQNGIYELYKDKHGIPVGIKKKAQYTDYELELKAGDSVFVYTDGVAEATDAEEALFGTERTLEALNADADASPEETLKNIRAAVDAFVKEAPQFDDLTMLSLKYRGA